MANDKATVIGEYSRHQWANHVILIAGMAFILGPILLILASSTHSTATLQQSGLQWHPGTHAMQNYSQVLSMEAGFFDQVTPLAMLRTSLVVALGVGFLTTLFSFLTAYAIVFFDLPWTKPVFWLILATLLFPLESRFITTFQITATLGLINTHVGMILPVLAAALGTFFFRQYFLGLPKHLIEAALMDGAGPYRFLVDIVLPMSLSRSGVVFVIAFMIGWNQYLWPLMISTDDSMYTLVRGIRLIGQESGPGMALVVITMVPPFILLLGFQRWFYHSLTSTE